MPHSFDPEPKVGFTDAPANVSKGFATYIGQAVGAAFALIALVTAVLDGDHSQETVTALIISGTSFVTLMAGRFAQAYALLKRD